MREEAKRRLQENGFSLISLLVVVVCIIILVGVVIVSGFNFIDESKNLEDKASGDITGVAAEKRYLDNFTDPTQKLVGYKAIENESLIEIPTGVNIRDGGEWYVLDQNAVIKLGIDGVTKPLVEDASNITVEDEGKHVALVDYSKGKVIFVKIKNNLQPVEENDGYEKPEITASTKEPRNTIRTDNKNGIASGPIVVTIQYKDVALTNPDRYQYKVGDSGTWKTATKTQTIHVTENGKIYARYNSGTETYGEASLAISNIDNIDPELANPTVVTSINKIKIVATATDTASPKASRNTAGILRYEFSIDGGATWVKNEIEVGSYTFEGLNKNTSYNIHVKAIDKAGNEAVIRETAMTEDVPTHVTFSCSPSDCSNQDVIVTINYSDVSRYDTIVKEYKIGESGTWKTYTNETSIVLSNSETVYARYNDIEGVPTDPVSKYVCVDKIKPGVAKAEIIEGTQNDTEWYTSNVRIRITAGTDSGGAGVKDISYEIEGPSPVVETRGNSGTIITITKDGVHKIKCYTYDKAGNKSAAGEITIKKDATPPDAVIL